MRDKLKPYLDPKNLLKCFGILAACSLWLSIVIWSWNRGLNFAVPASSWVAKLPGSVFSTSGKLYLAQAGFVLFAFYLTVLVPDLLRRFFPGRVYGTAIPRNVRLAEAPSHGLPITAYDKHSRGAKAYLEVAEEILTRQ